jgi:hypothetical protein
MDGGTRRVAGSSDAALRRTSDVATAHRRNARVQSFVPEIDDLGRRSRKAVAASDGEGGAALLAGGVIADAPCRLGQRQRVALARRAKAEV